MKVGRSDSLEKIDHLLSLLDESREEELVEKIKQIGAIIGGDPHLKDE